MLDVEQHRVDIHRRVHTGLFPPLLLSVGHDGALRRVAPSRLTVSPTDHGRVKQRALSAKTRSLSHAPEARGRKPDAAGTPLAPRSHLLSGGAQWSSYRIFGFTYARVMSAFFPPEDLGRRRQDMTRMQQSPSAYRDSKYCRGIILRVKSVRDRSQSTVRCTRFRSRGI